MIRYKKIEWSHWLKYHVIQIGRNKSKRHLLLESVRLYFVSFFADHPLLPRTFIVVLTTIAEAAAAKKQLVIIKRRPYAVAAAGRKRPVISVRFLPAALGPSEEGGSIAPLSFTYQSILSQLENRYSLCSPLILDLPTALIEALFSTHENLWRHYRSHWLAVPLTFSQWGDDL